MYDVDCWSKIIYARKILFYYQIDIQIVRLFTRSISWDRFNKLHCFFVVTTRDLCRRKEHRFLPIFRSNDSNGIIEFRSCMHNEVVDTVIHWNEQKGNWEWIWGSVIPLSNTLISAFLIYSIQEAGTWERKLERWRNLYQVVTWHS